MQSYWERMASARATRRRALKGAAGLGAGAAALALVGCGGSDDGGGDEEGSGLVHTPRDTTSQAKAGGTLRTVSSIDAITFDILATSALGTISFSSYTYPRLVKTKHAKYPDRADGGIVDGDLAEEWEQSADHLQYTFKVRPGMKWDPREPTNGREIDAQDVVFTIEKFARTSPFRAALSYTEQNKSGLIESVRAVDNRTVVIKLAKPDSSFLPLTASNSGIWFMPRESDGGFDPKGTVRGYGPFLLDEYVSSQRLVWKKNPGGYYIQGRPYIDTIEMPIVSEYATRLSQFRAGGIYTSVGSQDDIIQLKRDLPELLVTRSEDYTFFGGGSWIGFGYDFDSPFKDERVRQAAFYLIDRELFAEVFGNLSRFEAEGFPIDIRHDSNIPGPYEGFWRDPMSESDFGPNAKFYHHNIEEAKKLLAAAGYPNGVDTVLHFMNGSEYGSTYASQVQTVAGMLQEGGFRIRQEPHQYGPIDWHTNIYYGYSRSAGSNRGFSGLLYSYDFPYPTYPLEMYANFHKDGSRFHGMTPTGNNAFDGDPYVNDACDKVQAEFDRDAQIKLAREVDAYMTGKGYFVPVGYGSRIFGATWPVIQNLGVFSGTNASLINYWLDETKPPLGQG